MKKRRTHLISAVLIVAAAAFVTTPPVKAQDDPDHSTMYLIKGDKIVSSYDVDEVDYVTFKLPDGIDDNKHQIYPAYYLVGDFCGWDLSKMVQLSHSDADVYTDPIFSAIVDVPANCCWKVANNLAFEQQTWDIENFWGPAMDGDESLTGKLHQPSGAGMIAEAGRYKFTFDMKSLDYTIEPFSRPDFLFTPGNSNGWNHLASQHLRYIEKYNTGFFYGLMVYDGDFKLTDGTNWDPEKTWGAGSEPGTLALGGNNITLPDGKGLYWIEVNLIEKKYLAVKVETLGVIGECTGWSKQINLTPNVDYTVWTTDIDLQGEWKIRINDNWGYNFGGDLANPVIDGLNLTASGTHITFDISGNWPVITLD